MESTARRVAVLRIGSLGDHLIAVPLYRRLRELHADERLCLISNIPAPSDSRRIGADAILPSGLFDECIRYPEGKGWRSVVAAREMLMGMRLRVLYYLMPRRSAMQLWRDRLFFGMSGIRVVGLDPFRWMDSQRSRYLPGEGLYEHETDRLARLVPQLSSGITRTAEGLSLQLSVAEREQARKLLSPSPRCAVAISIGTKFDVNHWGLNNWSLLVRRLVGVEGIDRLILLGAATEYGECEVLRAEWGDTAVNFCGRLSPRQSAAVLAEAKLYVSHDSGPMHMAAAVGVPIVAVFSSRNPPGVWYPLSDHKQVHYTQIDCMGCGRLRCDDRGKACIASISVDEVFGSCAAALSEHCLQGMDRR